MLVLGRKKFETITITVPGMDPIVVALVDVRGDKARIGIEAPPEMKVARTEILGKVKGIHSEPEFVAA